MKEKKILPDRVVIRILLALALIAGLFAAGWSVSEVFAKNNEGLKVIPKTAANNKTNLHSSNASLKAASEGSSLPGYWFTVMGAAFAPASSTMSYTLTDRGCLQPSTAGKWYANVNLPDGSIIEYISFGYDNTSSSTASTVWLTRYSTEGSSFDLSTMGSKPGISTGAGYFSDTSPEFEIPETVDNLTYAYAFVWGGSTTQALCSLKVGYVSPTVYGVAIPLIQNNH